MLGQKLHFLVFYFSLLLVALTMPLHKLANSIAIILLILSWFAEGDFKKKFEILAKNKLLLIFIAFYLFHVIGMLYSENAEKGWFVLQKKLSLFIIPLAIGTSEKISSKLRENIYTSFIISCLIASVICICYGLYFYFFHNDVAYLHPKSVTSVIGIDRIYLAIYLSLCVFLIYYFLKKYWSNYSITFKAFLILLSIYFLGYIILLGAKTDLAVTIFLLSILGLFPFSHSKQFMKGVFVIVLLSAAIGAFIYKADFLKSEINKIINSDFSSSPDGENVNSLTIRIIKWQCSLEGIKENLFFGTGTGDSQDYLNKCYERKNFWGQYPAYHFNSHNQYFETMLALGLVGLVLLLACMIIPLVSAFRKKQILFISFLLLFAFNSLTESLLERQHGIVFFSFFISLFAFCKEE